MYHRARTKRLVFTAAVDDPVRFRRSRDIGAHLGFVPRRYQPGNFDYTGGSSKCGDQPTSLSYSSL
jgi:transposase